MPEFDTEIKESQCDDCGSLGRCPYFEPGTEPVKSRIADRPFLIGMYYALRGRCPAVKVK